MPNDQDGRPLDRDGNLLSVGDMVTVPCKIRGITQTEEYCNVTLETEGKMFPGEDRTHFILNSRQVIKKGF